MKGVVQMSTPNLDDLRLFLDIDGDEFSDELPLYLGSAIGTIAQRCGPVEPTEYTIELRADNGALLLPEWPVQSVDSITDSQGNSLDLSGAEVHKTAGVVRVPGMRGIVTVTYTAGYDPCPDDLEMAVYVVAGHLWDTQRGRSGSFSQIHGLDDDAPVGGDASFYVMRGFALPRRAMELTRPYTKAGFR